MGRLLFLAAFSAAAACSTARPAPPAPRVNLSAEVVGDECRFHADGQSMTLDELIVAADAWRRRGVHLDATVDTPYKCIGGAIFALQRAGVKRIDWAAEPPPEGR